MACDHVLFNSAINRERTVMAHMTNGTRGEESHLHVTLNRFIVAR